MKLRWSYCVTTVPSRKQSHLPKTLASLAAAGFDRPVLFVDGCDFKEAESYEREFGLEVEVRRRNIRTFGHWVLSLADLYIRQPDQDRYAVFQDDLVTYKNLRGYLDRSPYPDQGYWNLYTFPPGRQQAPPPNGEVGWFKSNQFGRGAVGLVFDNQTVITLLTSLHMVERPKDSTRGHRAVDGGVVTALKKAGWTEYVHHPSLVQHTGLHSSMGSSPHQLAETFRGEGYDALEMLEAGSVHR